MVDRFGPLRFGMALIAEPGGLSMRLRRWWLGPLPLPVALAPRPTATERAEAGAFRFNVAIGLPFIGLVVRYVGRLRRL